ncbi:hypothetical protein [Catalinimonas alkaloidigena]|nr:hypothetical protein [Catalinimonas alkaloidigena]
MKTLLSFACALVLLAGCQSSETRDETAAYDSTTTEMEPMREETLCFEQEINGVRTEVHLTLAGGDVTGEYNWLPPEKDARRGSVRGSKEGNTILATYDYMIEGQNQTEEITMELTDEGLMITRPGQVEIDGAMFDRDSGEETTETLDQVDCAG